MRSPHPRLPADARQADRGDGLTAADTIAVARDVALEGGYNLRDLGGYPTRDGRRVARGRLFRSAALHALTDADIAAIDALGIRLVVDLRTNRERGLKPSRGAWATWSRDYDTSTADLHRAIADPALTLDTVSDAMRATYRALPEEQADAYAALVRRIAADDLPLLFHCAVGKDRTGVAAALILDLLGVPRATVVADYLLTNRVTEQAAAHAHESLRRHNDTLQRAMVAPVARAEASYLDAMFAAVETRYGSVERYVVDRLGMSGDAIDAIRAALLVGR
ncbi:tyrosine-protein phosphatase [Sphingomonas oligophenolica]|uniref:tyrosine-protein phosphatase n=1 Tax=Sphingomonas oligophenolica TaxID=301154 RepID=UPI001386F370|nr:tyrosine-protein phosphatase [Sphingomonas oligophenolica]